MLFSSLNSFRSEHPTAVTIGNFDGSHLGHQELLKKTLDFSKSQQCRSTALTFNPRPEAWFRGTVGEPLLFSESQKHRALTEFGIADHIVQPFDVAFSETPHEYFTTEHLKKRLNARAIIIGDNFRFGYRRLGDADYLIDAGKKLGFEVFVIPAAQLNDEAISSTRVRAAVKTGNIDLANRLLGRPYVLEGSVVKGDQIGRQIGFPTANIEQVEQLIPSPGVYAAWMKVGKAPNLIKLPPIPGQRSVVNIGFRPTIKETGPLKIEAHALDAAIGENELYDQQVAIYLIGKIRNEKKFANIDELKSQITQDIESAKPFFLRP